MQASWDNLRLQDRERHRGSRRRWSPALRAECSSQWSSNLIHAGTGKKQTASAGQTSIPKHTKKEIENAQKLLRLQADGFVRSLEIQSLQNNVSQLLQERRSAEDGFREFQTELQALEHEVLADQGLTVLDYSLSEGEWLDIIQG
jgi:hypothetical protein